MITDALFLRNPLIVLLEVKAHMGTGAHAHTHTCTHTHMHMKIYARTRTHVHTNSHGHIDTTQAQGHTGHSFTNA